MDKDEFEEILDNYADDDEENLELHLMNEISSTIKRTIYITYRRPVGTC